MDEVEDGEDEKRKRDKTEVVYSIKSIHDATSSQGAGSVKLKSPLRRGAAMHLHIPYRTDNETDLGRLRK